MAGLLDFLGGAAGAYAGIANENRQRSQMEEYNNRLRQQELEDWKKKEQYRQQLAREGRAGELLGSPQITPTGQMVGLRYNERGTDPTLAVLGEIPGQREEYERGLLQQQMKQERDAALDAALLQQRLASANASDARAMYSRERTQNPERFQSGSRGSQSDDRAFNEYLRGMGIFKQGSKYMMEPMEGFNEVVGQGMVESNEPIEISPMQIEEQRRLFRGEAPQERRREPRESSSGMGSSEATAIPVTSEEEAYKHPGKWVRLGNMVTKVPG